MKELKVLRIRAVEHLCRLLKCSRNELEKICDNPASHYYEFDDIVNGKKRHFATPQGRLDDILRNLQGLLCRVTLPDYLHGGVRGKSPKTNAKVHIGKMAVLNFDLQDFFPSIGPRKVYKLFCDRLLCGAEVARILTRLVTLNGCIPQGSPTSTVIANLVIVPLATRLHALSEGHKCGYTQFVDDGSISGRGYIERLRPLIDKIILQEGFRASPKEHKRQTKYRHQEQVVTGIKVNRRIDVPVVKMNGVQEEIKELSRGIKKGRGVSAKKIRSLNGKVQHIKSLHQEKGDRLQSELGNVLRNLETLR